MEIKQIRLLLGLTQEEMAAAVGVAVTTVSRWENGRSHPLGLLVTRRLARLERKSSKIGKAGK